MATAAIMQSTPWCRPGSYRASALAPGGKIAFPRNTPFELQHFSLLTVSQQFPQGVIDQGPLGREPGQFPALFNQALIQNNIGSCHRQFPGSLSGFGVSPRPGMLLMAKPLLF